MRRAIGMIVVLLAGLPFLRGDPPPAKPTVEQLIEQLNDKRFAVRQAAEKAIEEIGPPALPALRKALAAKPSLDLARRIEKWIPQFELAALSNPKRITLEVTARPLQEVLEMIAKQSGYPIALQPDADKEKKPFDFKFERATFWEALDAVCSSGGMIASRDAQQKGFQLAFSDKYQPFVHRHGAFRVVGQGFNYNYQHSRSRSNQFDLVPRKKVAKQSESNESESESLQLYFHVEAEPRVAVVGLGDVIVSEAIDDQKRSLVPDSTPDEGTLRHVFGGLRGFAGPDSQVSVPLKAPSKNAKKVVLLKGTVAVYLEKEKKIKVLAEKFLEAKGKKFLFGKISMKIDEAKRGDDQGYELHLTLTGGEGNKGEISGDFELFDAKGKAYRISCYGWGGSSDGSETLNLRCVAPDAQTGPPTKLVFVRSVTMKYSLPFQFRDLPLP